MVNKNIQMKKREGDTWFNLFPLTITENVFNPEGKNIEKILIENKENLEQELNQTKTELEEEINQTKTELEEEIKKHTKHSVLTSDYGSDGSAVNEAINHLSSTGGTVLVDNVITVSDEDIVLKPKVNLIGRVDNKIILNNFIIKTVDDGEFNIEVSGLNIEVGETINSISALTIGVTDEQIRVKNIDVHSNNVLSNGKGNNGISINNAENISVYDNNVEDSGNGNGILVTGGKNIYVYNNRILRSGRAGIQVFEKSENVNIYDNYVYSWMLRREVTDGGIDSYGPSNKNIHVYNNIVDTGITPPMNYENTHSLIRMQGVQGCYVHNNLLHQRSKHSAYIFNTTRRIESEQCTDLVIENNQIFLYEDTPFIYRVGFTRDFIFRNNKVTSKGGKVTNIVIQVRDNTEYVLIEGNSFLEDLGVTFFHIYHSNVKVREVRLLNNTFINQSGQFWSIANIAFFVDFVEINGNKILTTNDKAIPSYPSITHLMIVNNIVRAGSEAIGGHANISSKVIANNLEL